VAQNRIAAQLQFCLKPKTQGRMAQRHYPPDFSTKGGNP